MFKVGPAAQLPRERRIRRDHYRFQPAGRGDLDQRSGHRDRRWNSRRIARQSGRRVDPHPGPDEVAADLRGDVDPSQVELPEGEAAERESGVMAGQVLRGAAGHDRTDPEPVAVVRTGAGVGRSVDKGTATNADHVSGAAPVSELVGTNPQPRCLATREGAASGGEQQLEVIHAASLGAVDRASQTRRETCGRWDEPCTACGRRILERFSAWRALLRSVCRATLDLRPTPPSLR